MKTTILLSMLCIYSFSQAQVNSNEKENNYKWGLSAAINSIYGQMGFPGGTGLGVEQMDENGNMFGGANRTNKSFSWSIVPKYFINNNFLLRFEFGRGSINCNAIDDYYESSTHYIETETMKQSITRFAPAVQWNYFRKKFIETYCGISFIYMGYGKFTDNLYWEYRDSATSALTQWTKQNSIIDGGYAAGIGAFSGFNIYLQKHISFGAEFSSSYMYYKIGGARIVDGSSQIMPNPPTSTLFNWTYSYKGFRFSNILSSFNISVWF